MAKKKVASNIQENHTLGEYQRYFSHLLGKGKLNRYSLDEKKKLDEDAQKVNVLPPNPPKKEDEVLPEEREDKYSKIGLKAEEKKSELLKQDI